MGVSKHRVWLFGLACFVAVLVPSALVMAQMGIVTAGSDGTATSEHEDPAISDESSYQSFDLNADGNIDVLDMILVGQHMNETGAAGWEPEDINNDGVVNVLDMILVGQNETMH